MKHLGSALLFCASGTLAAVAVHPNTASAAWVLQSAYDCFLDQPPNSSPGPYAGAHYGVRNVAHTPVTLFCPAADSTALPKSTVTTMNVEVIDNSVDDFVWTKACVSFRTTIGGACDSHVVSGTSYNQTGYFQLKPPTTVWVNNPWESGYVWISIPTLSNGNASKVSGLWYNN